jgi:UDP-2,4-diacetamido-2,4,6-trideoxy-beta-L-altropyranose hydrolase
MSVRVQFVVAAGPSTGRGHLGRALALAEASWPPGTILELVVDPEDPLTERERGRFEEAGGHLVSGGPIEPGAIVVLDVPEADVAIAGLDPARLVVFDDRETFTGSAAIIVQPSLPSWSGRASADRVLAGFGIAPIGAEVRRRRADQVTSGGNGVAPAGPVRVLVCFGGSDPDRVTARLTPAIASAVAGAAELDVVIGPSYSGPTDGWPVVPTRDPADLVDRLARADLIIAGAGTMKFEIACLGRPMLLLAVADDQRPVGPTFAASGAARYLGDGRSIDPAEVGSAVRALLDDPAERASLGQTAARVVDGAGGDRLAAAIVELYQPAGSS